MLFCTNWHLYQYSSTSIHLQFENIVIKGSTFGYILRTNQYGLVKRSMGILPLFSQVRSKFGSLFEAVGRVAKGKLANQRPVKIASINSLEPLHILYLVFLRIYAKAYILQFNHISRLHSAWSFFYFKADILSFF